MTATGRWSRVRKANPVTIFHLNVVIDKGRIEDLLQMGAKTDPPVMTGVRSSENKILFAARERDCQSASASARNICRRERNVHQSADSGKDGSIESARPGKSRSGQTTATGNGYDCTPATEYSSNVAGHFFHGRSKDRAAAFGLQRARRGYPLAGVYSLDGKQFDFTGHARMQAHVSRHCRRMERNFADAAGSVLCQAWRGYGDSH